MLFTLSPVLSNLEWGVEACHEYYRTGLTTNSGINQSSPKV